VVHFSLTDSGAVLGYRRHASRRTSNATRTRCVPLIIIQRQIGHSNLGITSIYLQGIDNAEIIDTVHARHAPMVPVSASIGC
jgi:hypothetical protein